jgi:hypothetical protein
MFTCGVPLIAFTPLLLDGPLVSGTSGPAHCIGTIDTGIESRQLSGNSWADNKE